MRYFLILVGIFLMLVGSVVIFGGIGQLYYGVSKYPIYQDIMLIGLFGVVPIVIGLMLFKSAVFKSKEGNGESGGWRNLSDGCPSCGKKYGYLYSFGMLNPIRHKCKECGALLAIKYSWLPQIGAGVFLIYILSELAIHMDKRLCLKDGCGLFAIFAFAPLLVGLAQYQFWKSARLKEL